MKFGKNKQTPPRKFYSAEKLKNNNYDFTSIKRYWKKNTFFCQGSLHKQQNRQFKITGQFCVGKSRSDEQLLIPTNYIIDSYVYQTRV